MSKLKVCHLTSAHKSYDTRIFFKECVSIAASGVSTYLVVTGTHDHEKYGVNIVNAGEYYESRLKRMLIAAWRVYRAGVKIDADIYHFHDPELLPYGLILKLSGRKVVYDVHEDVAADILDKDWIAGWLRKSIAGMFDFLEKVIASGFDGIAAVTVDIANKFKSRKRTKVVLVRNFPVISLIDNVAKDSEIKGEKFILIYSGMLTRNRGLVPLIQALHFVPQDIELWLLGEWENEALQNECSLLSGYTKVRYLGRVSQEMSIARIKEANVGMINFLPIPNHVTALPNKPFEYMACGLPMIMSDFDSWKEMFTGCALFVNPNDSKDIAEKITYLYQNRQMATEFGQKGFNLVRDRYSWESESKTLVNLYNEIQKD